MKKTLLLFLFLSFALPLTSAAFTLRLDTLVQILKLNDKSLKEHRLIKYTQDIFGGIPIDSVKWSKVKFDRYLANYYVDDKEAYDAYIESIYQNRLLNNDAAQADLLKAIDIAAKSHDHFLLYVFLSHLAFIQTYNGNAIGAIASFGQAKKEAMKLKDDYLQVIIDINISDIYYRYYFYGQSLDYLQEAQAIVTRQKMMDPRLRNVIYYNKSENYFRMNSPDSLVKYHGLLLISGKASGKLHTYIKRTEYYIYLLNHQYKMAIELIGKLRVDKAYKYETIDNQNLADAWVNAGQPDSANRIINTLLADKAQNNHPEIKYHLYELLGEIAAAKNDNAAAADNFKLALQESKENISKLIKVGDVSSRLKIDELQSDYFKKDRLYRRERILLIFLILVALLTIAVVAMFYRNVRQKRHYEKLLFASKKEELAHINSHDIRRHLTNILGIIDVLRHSEDKENEYMMVEKHLFYSADQLDRAIKNISQKLDEEGIVD